VHPANPTAIEIIIKPPAGCANRVTRRVEQKALALSQLKRVVTELLRKQLWSDFVILIG